MATPPLSRRVAEAAFGEHLLIEDPQRDDHEDRGLVVDSRNLPQQRLLALLEVARRVTEFVKLR
jgi:hypothetical protein